MKVPRSDPELARFLTSLQSDLEYVKAQVQGLMVQQNVPPTGVVFPQESGLEASEGFDMAADSTMSLSQLNKRLIVNCSVASALTLPVAIEGAWARVFNYGAAALTIKNSGGTAIGIIYQHMSAFISVWPDASGVPSWPSKAEVIGSSNATYVNNDVIQLDNTKGAVLKDTAGTPHYWRTTVNAAGALVTTDIGVSPPSLEDPPA